MSQSSINISIGHNDRIEMHPEDHEVKREFLDIKRDLADNAPRGEVTNKYALSVMIDVYWLHIHREVES